MDDSIVRYSEYRSSFVKTKMISIADQVADTLNQDQLTEILRQLAYEKEYYKEGYLLAFGRYANSKQISQLVANMKEWENWGKYGVIGRKNIIIARGALMLSDTREAMLALDKSNNLSYYATIRGTDIESLRNTILDDYTKNNEN